MVDNRCAAIHPDVDIFTRRVESFPSNLYTLGLQPPPEKVVRPPKLTLTTFSGGGWRPRDSTLTDNPDDPLYDLFHMGFSIIKSLYMTFQVVDLWPHPMQIPFLCAGIQECQVGGQ